MIHRLSPTLLIFSNFLMNTHLNLSFLPLHLHPIKNPKCWENESSLICFEALATLTILSLVSSYF